MLLLTTTQRRHRLKCCHALANWTSVKWNQVLHRFRFISDGNRVNVWRPRSECLHPAFALQRPPSHTITVVMVWDAIAYNTRSPLVMIRGTMTA
ncbi:transposable element Tcb1 transposase [Trichonephila clavipes]|nr:transposable element Tcb1 transposase [Trichonephila clavipes]